MNIKKLAISQIIIFDKNMIIQKRSLIIVILNIRVNQIINKIYNIGIIKYKDINNNKDITHYFRDLLINLYDKYILKLITGLFYVEFG